jgi:hypothetical protein
MSVRVMAYIHSKCGQVAVHLTSHHDDKLNTHCFCMASLPLELAWTCLPAQPNISVILVTETPTK